MEKAGFEYIGEYVLKIQNTVAQYIVLRPILDFCEDTVHRPAVWVARIWCKQEGLDLAGKTSATTAAEEEEG